MLGEVVAVLVRDGVDDTGFPRTGEYRAMVAEGQLPGVLHLFGVETDFKSRGYLDLRQPFGKFVCNRHRRWNAGKQCETGGTEYFHDRTTSERIPSQYLIE